MEFFNSLPLSQYSKEPYLALRILVHSISSLTAIIQLIFANNAEMISLKVERNSLRLWLDLIIVTQNLSKGTYWLNHLACFPVFGWKTKNPLLTFWFKNRGDPRYFKLAPSLLKPDLWQKLVHHAITHIPWSKEQSTFG